MLVGIIGSGAMGSGIIQVAATAGHAVIVYDSREMALDSAKKNIDFNFLKLVEKKKIELDKSDEIRSRISFTKNLQTFAECQLVIEAIVEDLELKRRLFSDLESIVSKECILATNTSSLSITSIASVCKNPERVIGIHFFNPATIMQLVEIIPGITTAEHIVEFSKKIIDSWGKITVLAKDTPGFIVNRLARSYYGEPIRIFEEGIADFSTIDWALKAFGGFKMGPFELMDFIGNDINYKVTETIWTQFFYEPRYKPSFTQKRLFEAKYFGRKSGLGYYNYTSGAKIPEPVIDEELGKYIFNRILCMLINEAMDALYMKIASKEDLDLAVTKGLNYPKGLLKWGDELGLQNVFKTFKNLQDDYGEDRYRPSILLKKMVNENRKNY